MRRSWQLLEPVALSLPQAPAPSSRQSPSPSCPSRHTTGLPPHLAPREREIHPGEVSPAHPLPGRGESSTPALPCSCWFALPPGRTARRCPAPLRAKNIVARTSRDLPGARTESQGGAGWTSLAPGSISSTPLLLLPPRGGRMADTDRQKSALQASKGHGHKAEGCSSLISGTP